MNNSIQRIKDFLTECADHGDISPGTFHRNIKKKYKKIHSGSFRTAYDAGKYVVKIVNVDNDSDWDENRFEDSNKDEVKNYQKLVKQAPNMAFFVMEPVLVEVPGFDAAVMPKVRVCVSDKDFRDYARKTWCGLLGYANEHFTRKMLSQLKFIRDAFTDTHDNNIGWDFESERVWLIDYNHDHHIATDREAKAKGLVARLTKTKAKKVA